MSWGTKKRNFILTIFFTLLFFIAGIVTFIFLYEEPTCFDKKQNGDEKGVDCGGSCSLVCSNSVLDPVVEWVRYFKIADGIYSTIAYIQNPNTDAGVKNIPYIFKLYDDKGVTIAEKAGRISLNPRQVIPIVETGLITDQSVPVRASFDFTEEFVWQKENKKDPVLIIKDEQIVLDKEVQKISAEVFNSSLENITKVSFIVIVYDKSNNAIASSATFIDEIVSGQTIPLLFTWPSLFNDQISRFEIIPVYQ